MVVQGQGAVVGVKVMNEDTMLVKVLVSMVNDLVAAGQVVVRGIHADGLTKDPTHVTARRHAKKA